MDCFPRRWLLPCLVLILFIAQQRLPAQPSESVEEIANPVAETSSGDGTATPRRAIGIPRHPVDIMEAMGVYFVVPFGLASVIAVWFSIERLIVLRHGRVLPRPFIERFLQHLEQSKLEPVSALQLLSLIHI